VELASDYPVPPLDLVVPTSTRARERTRAVAGTRGSTSGKETE
jgi:hypothetical protein